MIVLYFLEHQSEWNKNISLVWQINEVLDELELPLLEPDCTEILHSCFFQNVYKI